MLKRTLELDGRAIEILESQGRGDPLYLIHGNSSAANVFEALLRGPLGKEKKLIAFSLPGHGGSAPLEARDRISIEEIGRVAGRVVRELGYARYWLLGASLGGHAVLEALEEFPGVLGVILVSAPPISVATIGAAFHADPSGGLLFKGALDDAEVQQLASCFVAPELADASTLVSSNIRRTDPTFRPTLGASLALGEIRDELAAVVASTIPVAVFAGACDRFLRAAYYETLPVRHLWKNEVTWFRESGHAINLYEPDRFERVVREFTS